IEVSFSSQRLAALGLTPQHIFAALAQQNQLNPSGSVDTDSDRVFVRVDGALRSAADVANVSVSAGGRLLKLSDIAEVRYTTADPADFKVRYQGESTVIIGVTLQKNGDILAFGQDLKQRIDQVRAELPLGISLAQIADQSTVVKESVWEFEKVFLEALAIVLLVCFVALGWRTGLVVATSVPLVLGLVAMVMYSVGWNLDRISLGALIIALGLLVDDAIIAVEMMVVKLEEGWDRLSAAGYAYTSTAFPMLTGTMITVAGFMPVGFAKSTSGEYAGGIFWVVGTALIVSWLVAVIFIPYLGTVMLPKNLADKVQHDPYNRPIYQRFRRLVAWAVRRKGWVLSATAGLFLLAVVGMGLVQQQFFPTASRPELLVELRMKEGAAFQATEHEVRRLEQVLKQDPDIQYFTSYIGQSTPRFFLSLSPELPNPNYAQIVIMTKSTVEREAVRQRLMQIFDENLQFPALRGRVTRLEFGPPVGFPVQFRVMGPDVDQIRQIADQVRDEVRKSPLVRDTQLEWSEQVRSLNIRIDQDKVRLLGLSSTDVANTVQAVLSGAPVSQIRRGEELVSVVVRASAAERQQLDQLDGINLFTPTGAVVPLSQVATIEPSFEEPVLWRRNRDVVLTVRSDVVDGVQAPYASQQIMPRLQPIIDQLPVGYRIEMGGAIEESAKANEAIAKVFPAMLLVMLFFLMLQVQSFARMGLVLLTAPLGMIGVVPALLISNAPFGFVALLGVIALSGMIMRNSVILVVQIDQEIREGRTAWDAVIEATIRRARPVVLTAAAAVLAMIPLSTSVFWGPMAIAIMGGLLIATGLTLLFVPALYALWFRVKPPVQAV
ncbi:MAG: efflux RND transporter permease subunit, partial [Pseudomonadota bacterium]|nr:efflux RND transporter permease subunit [Pseudomonadota bacterium]